MNLVDMDTPYTAILPWPTTANGTSHEPEDAAAVFARILDDVPAERLHTAAVDVSRDDHIEEHSTVLSGTLFTGEHVRTYLHARLDTITTAAETYGVADRWIGVLTAEGPDDTYDAAIVLTECLDTWPAPSAAPGAPLAERLIVAVEAVAADLMRPSDSIRCIAFECTSAADGGVNCDEVTVDFASGDSDDWCTVPGITTSADPELAAKAAVLDDGDALAVRLMRNPDGTARMGTDVRDAVL